MKLTKVQPLKKLRLVRSVYTGIVYHLQVSEHAHGACFLFGIEKTFGVPFLTIWPPNLGQAVRTA